MGDKSVVESRNALFV